MEITRTINADKRYYLDENLITNADSLIETIRRFNDIQMQMYNLLYEKKYMASGSLTEQTYSSGVRISLKQTIIITVQFIHVLPACSLHRKN